MFLCFRLFIGAELGFGNVIGYQCIGTEDPTIGQPDMMGQLIKFKASKLHQNHKIFTWKY